MTLATFKTQKGAAVLMMTAFILVAAFLLLVYQARFSSSQTKIAGNQLQNTQAFMAGEAGLQYGLAYFKVNYSTIVAGASGGFINSTISTVTLANSSSFSVVISNPTASNYNVIDIVSTGVSRDGTSTRIVRQQVASTVSYINSTALSKGNVTFVGGSKLTNTITNINVQTGGTFTVNNGATTYTSSGQSSSQGNIKADVQENITAYQSMTEPQFFQSVFGASEASVKAGAVASSTYYNNTVSGGDYSQTLKNKNGVTIYIDQANVSLGQGVSIGTAANPVTIIVQGNLTIANGVVIYGFVYSGGSSFSLAGGANMTGGIASYGTMNISNGFILNFAQVPKVSGGSTGYSPIPGSWRDF